MNAYAYSDQTSNIAWCQQFRALYIVHCPTCGEYFSIECCGTVIGWPTGKLGKCSEIQVDISCPNCHTTIDRLFSYSIDKLPRIPTDSNVYEQLHRAA